MAFQTLSPPMQPGLAGAEADLLPQWQRQLGAAATGVAFIRLEGICRLVGRPLERSTAWECSCLPTLPVHGLLIK